MVVESAIHDAKGIASQFRVFKRPRKGESRFVAGARRIMEQTWLRYIVEQPISVVELKQNKRIIDQSLLSDTDTQFKRLKTISVGGEQFALSAHRKEKKECPILQARQRIEIVTIPLRPSEVEVEPPSLEEKEKRTRRAMYEKLRCVELKALLKERNLRCKGKIKVDMIECLVENPLSV